MLDYVQNIHQQDDDMRRLQQIIGRYPKWELRTVPLHQLKIPDAYYPDDPDPTDRDPYGRVLFVDYDYAGEVSARNVDRLPIVVDPQGWIIDGNLRAWAAAELLNRDSIKAWVAVPAVEENFADGKKPGRRGLSKRVGIPQKATLAQLEKIAKSSTGERRRMAQWQLNMRRGRAKKSK